MIDNYRKIGDRSYEEVQLVDGNHQRLGGEKVPSWKLDGDLANVTYKKQLEQ